MVHVEVCVVHDDLVVWQHQKPEQCCDVGECDFRYFGNVKWDTQWIIYYLCGIGSVQCEPLPRVIRRARRFDIVLPFNGLFYSLENMRTEEANIHAAKMTAELRVRLPAIVRECIRGQLYLLILKDVWPADDSLP